MKYIVTLLLALSLTATASAQLKKQGPNGYLSLEEYKAGKPSSPYIFYAVKRAAALTKVAPGHDYKLECNDPSIDKDYLNDRLWGVVYKDTLYVNGKRFTGLDGYAKAEATGRFVYMALALPLNPKYKSVIGDYADAPAIKTGSIPKIGGMIGGAVKGASDRISTRIPVIYDTETDECRCITTDLLYRYSTIYPELKDRYGLIKVENLSVYAFREFASDLNAADRKAKEEAAEKARIEEEKARIEAEKAAQEEAARQAAEEAAAQAEAEQRTAPDSSAQPADSTEQAPATDPANDPNKVQVSIPIEIPMQ
ncbi:DUF6563 family protein [uncultured Alistipes sp.]|uniref:DUF6563 family protein n=2 Tax=uncultured Alistipes sp. TaxID=538949 RepID=UPI0026F13235|nr:DUF6563 family protein [uncultured Alistipes sp.]